MLRDDLCYFLGTLRAAIGGIQRALASSSTFASLRGAAEENYGDLGHAAAGCKPL